MEQIKDISGVTDVQVRYMMYAKDKKGNLQSIGVLNQKQFEDEAYQGSLKGTVDYESASSNDEILYGWSYFVEDSGYKLGRPSP